MSQMDAIDIYDPLTYPTRRDEDWKYSDLPRVLRQSPRRVPAGRILSKESGVYTLINGVYPDITNVIAEGQGHISLHHMAYAVVAHAMEHPSGEMEIQTYAKNEHPVAHQSDAEIVIPAGRDVILFETYNGWEIWRDGVQVEKDERPYVANTTLRFKLGDGASLIRVVLLDEPEEAVSIRRSTVETAPGSVFRQYVFSTGAKFQRFETHVDHAGHGATVEMNGAYLLSGKRHFDLTTRVRHGEVDGVTNQLIKGLVKDSATAVFQGRILVERGADGTDARMRHQALMLNDGAHVRAKPELEIYADDVQCAHGNTIGALDEEALFFCMSRGMNETQARALLTHAFVLPVADMIPDDELRQTVLDFLEHKAGGFDAV